VRSGIGGFVVASSVGLRSDAVSSSFPQMFETSDAAALSSSLVLVGGAVVSQCRAQQPVTDAHLCQLRSLAGLHQRLVSGGLRDGGISLGRAGLVGSAVPQ
jgi:hypothetical protein